MEITLEVNKKSYSLGRFSLDLLCIGGGGTFSYWMLSNFQNVEQWFEGRRSDGLSFFVDIFLALIGAWDMTQGIYKTVKLKFAKQ
jgi:hypothetical protein